MGSKNQRVKNDSQSVSRYGHSLDEGVLLKKAIQRVDCEPIFENFQKHGNSNWSPSAHVILAILTAWMPCPHLTQAFGKASNLSTTLFGMLATQTYQGMSDLSLVYPGGKKLRNSLGLVH